MKATEFNKLCNTSQAPEPLCNIYAIGIRLGAKVIISIPTGTKHSCSLSIWWSPTNLPSGQSRWYFILYLFQSMPQKQKPRYRTQTNHLPGAFNHLCQRKHYIASPHPWHCWATTAFYPKICVTVPAHCY